MESELKCLTSESGCFYVDAVGVVRCFEPAVDNPLVDEVEDVGSPFCLSGDGLRLGDAWVKWHKTIRTLIIPHGVTEFGGEFMRSVHVRERFELPKGITRFGFNEFGMILRNSEYLADGDLHQVRSILEDTGLNDEYKQEFAQIVYDLSCDGWAYAM